MQTHQYNNTKFTLDATTSNNTAIGKVFVHTKNGEPQVLGQEDPILQNGECKVICLFKESPVTPTTNNFLSKLVNSAQPNIADNILSAVGLVKTMETPEACALEYDTSDSTQHANNSCAKAALGKAICITSTIIEEHIDSWLATVSDQQTEKTLQGSNIKLMRSFRTRLMQSLSQLEEGTGSETSTGKIAPDLIKSLTSSINEQTKQLLNQIDRRYNYLIRQQSAQSKNLIRPEALASCLFSAIADIRLHQDHSNALHTVIKESFNHLLDSIYREVNA